MTLPSERKRAVLQTEKFLLELTRTPGVSKHLKDTARHLLRHYPTAHDLELIEKSWNSVFECPFGDDFVK